MWWALFFTYRLQDTVLGTKLIFETGIDAYLPSILSKYDIINLKRKVSMILYNFCLSFIEGFNT